MAHGSRDPRAAESIEALLDLVRDSRPGLRVVTSYLDHAAPAPVPALTALPSADAVVLPLLLTPAYHSKIDIPGVLHAAQSRRPELALRTAGTLGPHPLMLDALERRLGSPDPDTAVVLVSAGSSDPTANAIIARMAHDWQLRGWWAVRPAYASAALPTPVEAIRTLYDLGAPRVVVASYFLAPGHFADRVRTAAEEAGAAEVSPALGAVPELAQIILDRYDAAVPSRAPVLIR
ncbi:MAG: sirohydrochlorin chelatase [Streptosporangiaceae bacterium]